MSDDCNSDVNPTSQHGTLIPFAYLVGVAPQQFARRMSLHTIPDRAFYRYRPSRPVPHKNICHLFLKHKCSASAFSPVVMIFYTYYTTQSVMIPIWYVAKFDASVEGTPVLFFFHLWYTYTIFIRFDFYTIRDPSFLMLIYYVMSPERIFLNHKISFLTR